MNSHRRSEIANAALFCLSPMKLEQFSAIIRWFVNELAGRKTR